MTRHVLRVLTTGGQVHVFTGRRDELVQLRNRLLFAVEHDREAVIRHALSTGNVELLVEKVAAVGVVEAASSEYSEE